MSERLLFLLLGAALASVGWLIRRRFERLDRERAAEDARESKREDVRQQQTRAALLLCLAAVDGLYEVQVSASTGLYVESVMDEKRRAAAHDLRRANMTVAQDDLRARIDLARRALEEPEAVEQEPLAAGIYHLVRYVHADLSAGIGAYLRDEPVPTRSEQMDDVDYALEAWYARPEQCRPGT